jgi:hypothetical protein
MEDQIQVPEDLAVTGSTGEGEPLAQPDKAAPSTGTEQTADDTQLADKPTEGDKPDGERPTDADQEPPKKTPWFVERIAKQREQLAQERQQREELAARLEALSRAPPGEKTDPNAPRPAPTPEQLQQMVRAEAARIAEQTAMQERLKSFDKAGRKDFPDFVDRCNTIASLGGAENPAFMQIVTDLEDGPKVVAQLADDPEKAIEILQMPPFRMAVALAKLSGQAAKPPPVSKAPAPIKAVSGATRVEPDDSKLSDEAWWDKERKASKG